VEIYVHCQCIVTNYGAFTLNFPTQIALRTVSNYLNAGGSGIIIYMLFHERFTRVLILRLVMQIISSLARVLEYFSCVVDRIFYRPTSRKVVTNYMYS